VYFGEHWLIGVRDEDKPAAKAVLDACRDAALAMDSSDIADIKLAWFAAMRAKRCYA
jgi:hypothetical protein